MNKLTKISDKYYRLYNPYDTTSITTYIFNNLKIEIPNSLGRDINNVIAYDALVDIDNMALVIDNIKYHLGFSSSKKLDFVIPLFLVDNLIINGDNIELHNNNKILKVPKIFLDKKYYGNKELFGISFNYNMEKEYYDIRLAWRNSDNSDDTSVLVFRPYKKIFDLLDIDFLMETALLRNDYFFQALNYFVLSSI